ncbi:general transcription factor IIH [Capsaspora owczarzaki ATCC 30864]|uniref:General transcription factor IIH subunit n=1 Tax=Capsaspora owczarzaki (strain ATCC 30864) TaxID=595528 RepID=A0A0D2X104_CAPO3|nr:general transcription factor IIH [Capsaspora owczarzaki ATCC 30864]KJE89964.1 general transcription factor IIH [Capsaspora owczarzaki ATCC 30864]|eukprot:XP_004349877.1 general transcription factor IIH [Capsaspora owczarzaki ATCC 30864]
MSQLQRRSAQVAVDEDDDMNNKGYVWEQQYERTWDVLQEDAQGSLRASVEEHERAKRRRFKTQVQGVRRGMMRHLTIILDMSSRMDDPDLKPTRLEHSIRLLEQFVPEFFDQNPISQLNFIISRDAKAERISELGGNPAKHLESLRKKASTAGEISLQNSLELARESLRLMPSHTSKEVLIIMGGLASCDPGDIFQTISLLELDNIHCSVIGLSAEVRICKYLAEKTKGVHNVIIDESHFRDMLFQHITPPPASSRTEALLIRMGFPRQNLSKAATLCACHKLFRAGGYICPQCKAKCCELPTTCAVCGLTLVSSPHLARSYHHLFPLAPFREVPLAHPPADANGLLAGLVANSTTLALHPSCRGCSKPTATMRSAFQCPTCCHVYCLDCDIFIHDTLHTCPSCVALLDGSAVANGGESSSQVSSQH